MDLRDRLGILDRILKTRAEEIHGLFKETVAPMFFFINRPYLVRNHKKKDPHGNSG
jgi:hypothetical protein